MSFSLLLWLMRPSLVLSYSVSVLNFFYLVLHSLQVIDVIYDSMHYAYVMFLFLFFIFD